MRVLYKPDGDGPGGVEEHVRKLKLYFDHVENEDMADIIHNHAISLSDKIDVFTLHGMFLKQDWGESQTPANMVLLDHLFRAKKVITVAEWYIPILEELGIYDAIHIPNCVELEKFKTGPFEYFLYLGSDGPVKNPNDVIRLADEVDYPFVISTERGIEKDNIDFAGLIPAEDVPDVISRSKAMIMPFAREVCSTVTLESFAGGKPILGAKGGSQSDLVVHKKTGYLYESFKDMIKGAHWLWEHAEELEENCLEESKKYELEKICKNIEKVYEDSQEIPVSVVILAYNNRETLGRAIRSCGTGVEIIVVDASHDHRDLVPDHCVYVQAENKSIGANRNIGVDLATREFIIQCDADDYCLDGKVSLYRFFNSDDIKIVFSNGWWGDTTFSTFSRKLHDIRLVNGEIIDPDLLLRGNIIPNGAAMFRASVAKELRFNEDLKCGVEDYDFWLRVSEIGKIKYMDRIVFFYNSNPQGITRVSKHQERVEEIRGILANAGHRRGMKKVEHAEDTIGKIEVSDYVKTNAVS